MNEPAGTSKTGAWAILLAFLILLLAVTFVARQEMTQIREFIGSSGWAGRLATVLIYAVLGATPIPSEPLTILASTIFGPFYAALAASVGNVLSAMVEYYIGRQIGSVTSFDEKRAKLPFGLGKLPVDSPLFLIGARNLPGYGAKFVSLAAGIYRVPLRRYLWTTIVAIVPGSVLVAYGGMELLQFLFNRPSG
jgi:uncharacterized membrane protein YdjX (TVP38/TMEM64 family)